MYILRRKMDWFATFFLSVLFVFLSAQIATAEGLITQATGDIGTDGAFVIPGRVEGVAVAVPAIPEVKVPLYPDVSVWYTDLGEVVARWDVPDDVTMVAMAMNQNPNTEPAVAEKELLTGKNFGAITEGVWYIHVRFRNIIGWSETAHYKISIDTTPPLPFEAKIDNEVSDNPSPLIIFYAVDAYSGIFSSYLYVDGTEVMSTAITSANLPIQKPGKHTLLVRVIDRAGNSVEDGLPFEILPLSTPVVEFLPRSVSQDEIIFASGTAIPNVFIDVRVSDSSGQEMFKGTAQSDNSGNWKVTVDKVLPTGKYILSAVARDERGAVSYAASDESFRIRPKIILALGSIIYLGWFEIFIIVLLLGTAAVSIYSWWYAGRKNTREAYKIIVGRDIEKLTTKLLKYLADLESRVKLPEPRRSAEITSVIGKMKDVIDRMKKYISQEVNKLK